MNSTTNTISKNNKDKTTPPIISSPSSKQNKTTYPNPHKTKSTQINRASSKNAPHHGSLEVLEHFKALARVDYAFYVEYVHRGQWIPAKHHLLIADKLKGVIEGKIKRIMFFLPP